jgi:tetratricopeptide (TPR) repeat protein
VGAPAIPGFRLLRPLGTGGMGAVFLVEPDGLPGARRALKVLTASSGADGASRRERFVREGELLARLQGAPGLVRVHGAGAHGDLLWLCMDYVDGRDLSLVMQERRRLPWPEATRIARGVALGLAEAHARGVIHRDVKAANVILDRAGVPALVDFGVAQATELERLTRTGVAVGTPVYFSPEQAAGRPLDGRTDVYSLGVLLYELLTGELPFADDVPFAALLEAIQHAAPAPPSAAAAGIPAQLDRAVLAALAKAPEQRPDARAWAGALDACLDLEHADVDTDVRRSKARLGLGVVAVTVGLGLVGLAFLAGPTPDAQPTDDPAPVAAVVVAPPPVEAAELAVSEVAGAAAAERPAALSRARAAVDALAPGPARGLHELRLTWDQAIQPVGRATLPEVLALLGSVRALAADESASSSVRARARLLEGEVLLGIGWPDTAAASLAGARDALAAEDHRPTWWLRFGTAGAVAPPDLAARVLLARARAQRLDDAAALAAAEDAVGRARALDAADVLVAAEVLRAEALALLGRVSEARGTLARAGALLEGAGPDLRPALKVEVDAMGARFARWGLGGDLLGLRVHTESAMEYVIEGEAELARATPLDPGAYPTLGRLDPVALARARRALRLAIAGALEPRVEGFAWALLARADLLDGDLEAAERAVATALSAAPDMIEARRADAMLRAARGDRAAVDDLRTCMRRVGTSTGRLPPRAATLLAWGAEALRALKSPRAQLPVLDELWALGKALRLPPPLRERIGQAALETARRASRPRDAERAEQALANLRAEVAELVPVLEAALADPGGGVLEGAPRAPLFAALERCPLDPTLYDTIWRRGGELEPWAFDVLSLVFELRPSAAPTQGSWHRRRNAASTDARELSFEVLGRHLRTDEPAPDLPERRDDDLRRLTLLIVAREAGLEVGPELLAEAIGASWRVVERHPGSPSGWLGLGYARLELGDPAGALVALERAAALHPPFESARLVEESWPRFYAALAHGALGEPAAAAESLRRAVACGFFFHERLKDPRLAGVPDLQALEIEARTNDRRR